MHIVKPVVYLLQGVVVVAANWDMKMEKGILINLDVRLKCAASEIDNLKPAPIDLIILLARQFKTSIKKVGINIRNTSNQLNLSKKRDMTNS